MNDTMILRGTIANPPLAGARPGDRGEDVRSPGRAARRDPKDRLAQLLAPAGLGLAGRVS